MLREIQTYFSKKTDATGLAVFRIFFAAVLFYEIHDLYSLRNLIYDKQPYFLTGELNVEYLFNAWFIILFLLFIGCLTRIATIVNYLFSVIIFSSALSYEYHIFYAYIGVNFLLIFMPLSEVISIDSLLKRLKEVSFIPDPKYKIHLVNYLAPVYVGISIVYLDSLLWKGTSDFWKNGLGIWLPGSVPPVVWNDFQWILNQKIFIISLGYITLLFEFALFFLMWIKKLRTTLMIVGILFHVGILLFFPIPYFALAIIVIYLLFIPENFWNWIRKKCKAKKSTAVLWFDSTNIWSNFLATFVNHFDIFGLISIQKKDLNQDDKQVRYLFKIETSKGVLMGFEGMIQILKSLRWSIPIAYFLKLPLLQFFAKMSYGKIKTWITVKVPEFIIPTSNLHVKRQWRENLKQIIHPYLWLLALVFFTVGQVIVSYRSPLTQEILIKNDLRYNRPNEWMNYLYENFHPPLKAYFGITHHGVFMDYHLATYNNVVKIEHVSNNGDTTLIPLINDQGMPFGDNQGPLFAYYTFGPCNSQFSLQNFESGILPILQHFDNKYKYNQQGKFVFSIKAINIPSHWELDFLKKQKEKPWKLVGHYAFSSNEFKWIEGTDDWIEKNKLNKNQ